MHGLVKQDKRPTGVPAGTRMAELKELGDIKVLAKAAGRDLSTMTDIREIKKLVDKLDDVRKIVSAVTGDRTKINTISDPMVEGIVKAGRMLREMAAKGERQGRGKPKRNAALRLQNAKDLGFTRARAQRWQLASDFPDSQRKKLKKKVLKSDDGLWSLGELLRAVKLWLGKRSQRTNVKSSKAKITCSSWQDWLPRQKACDLLLTDPPYSTDIEEIEKFALAWLPVALRKIKPTGRGYICIGAYPRELRAYLSVPTPKHLIFSQVLVWTYRNRVGPSPTHDYKLNWQAILYYRGTDAPPLNCSRKANPKYPDLNEQFTVQDINLPDARRYDERNASWHAWQKPVELCERFVRHASNPSDLILDPFAGTGSFLLAAASLGRKAFGCDNDPAMIKIAKKRGCLIQ